MAKRVRKNKKFSIADRHTPIGIVGARAASFLNGADVYKLYALDGIVTTSGSQAFKCPEMAGFGDDYFNGWQVGFHANNIGTTGLDVGELNFVSDYHDDGTFDTDADWSGSVIAGDEFLLFYPPASGGSIWIPAKPDASPLTSADLWSTTGVIKIVDIVGVVETVIETATTNCKLTFDPDDGGSDVDLCANNDLTADATGTIYRITGDISDALVASLDVVEASGFDTPVGIYLSQAGDIKVTYGAASTGKISWWLCYEPVRGYATNVV